MENYRNNSALQLCAISIECNVILTMCQEYKDCGVANTHYEAYSMSVLKTVWLSTVSAGVRQNRNQENTIFTHP